VPLTKEQIIAHIDAHVANVDDAIEHLKPAEFTSKRDIAERRWQIYLLVLSGDAVRGVAALLRAKEYRAAVVLARTIFEYRIKAEYLIKNRKEAYRQFRLLPKKVYTDLSKLSAPSDVDQANLVNMYLEWRRTAGILAEEYQGDIGASKMALAVLEDTKTDGDGKEYSPEFIHKYGIPSWTVHADAAGMAEVLPGFNNDHDWSIRAGAIPYEHFSTVALEVLHTVFDHLRAVRIAYDLDYEPLEKLGMRSLAVRAIVMREWRTLGDG
jgi:hypothetical protein